MKGKQNSLTSGSVELKLCFVNLDGRDCRALVEYTIARERDIGESYSSDDEGEGGSIAPSEPTMFEGPISEAPSQIGAPR